MQNLIDKKLLEHLKYKNVNNYAYISLPIQYYLDGKHPSVSWSTYVELNKKINQYLNSAGINTYHPLFASMQRPAHFTSQDHLNFDRPFIKHCNSMILLSFDGWLQSEGMKKELTWAMQWSVRTYKIPLKFENLL